MGGGDLNTKKAWHPNTLKNQERVWKAEQAAAEEQKRILELQRERAQERDREELNKLARQNSSSSAANSDNRLSWMYDKPDKKVQQEDYLLGKAIDKNYDTIAKPEQNEIPAVSRRVVGSSMITTGGDTQVDIARKLREDPLLLVKERERAARAALLNNPVQRRKLAELLRKEQEQKNQTKSDKKNKKKEKDIDYLLASKLNALGGEKGMDIAKLLASDGSSDSSSDEEKSKKKKKKKKKHKSKKNKHKHNRDSESPDESKKSKYDKSHKKSSKRTEADIDLSDQNKKMANNFTHETQRQSLSIKRKSDSDDNDDSKFVHKRKARDYSPYSKNSEKLHRDSEKSLERNTKNKEIKMDSRTDRERHRHENKRSGLSEEEKSKRLAAMVAAGAEREVERGRRVAEQLAENVAAEKSTSRYSSRNEARVLPDSLESRIHSNRHYIQRDKRHMNEHFARR